MQITTLPLPLQLPFIAITALRLPLLRSHSHYFIPVCHSYHNMAAAIAITTFPLLLQLPHCDSIAIHCHCFIHFHCLHKIAATIAIITLPFPLPLRLPLELLQMHSPFMAIMTLVLLLPLQLPHCLCHCPLPWLYSVSLASPIPLQFQHCLSLYFYRHYHFSTVPLCHLHCCHQISIIIALAKQEYANGNGVCKVVMAIAMR